MTQKLNSKIWILIYLILVIGALVVVAMQVIRVDPFFHYHQPDTDNYYYILNNERSQNDGIIKHFDYDAIITGTSMTQNFKTTEMDEIFGTNSIKIPYSGASYKEINDSLIVALKHNKNLKTIIRGLDINRFLQDKDIMRLDLGEYPTYLYDNNIFNDVQYIFNREVIFNRTYPMMLANDSDDFEGGITSFDAYSNWMARYTFGINAIYPPPDRITVQNPGEPVHLTEEEKSIVLGTVQQNITSLAIEYPNVTFYYFFPPYNAAWWKGLVDNGSIYKQIEAEEIVIEQILECDNIRLFSFNNLTNITTDLNNYKDGTHYGEWINSLMLRYMHDDKCRLTNANYKEYLDYELNYYLTFDYNSLNEQPDHENDYYAEALLNEEITGISPLEISATDYIISDEYVGYEIFIEDISDYKYLVFYGRKNQENGQPSVYIYDINGIKIAEYTDLDNGKHQYLIDVSNLSGSVRIIFNGGYVDNTGSADSTYTFTNITLY
jgi:hypothetical protein